ncbi:ketosteroid isomerase family protein [Thalassotalea profundi]|uniref:Nuclear transport factor 2 domain-containing protein n=1 Tax=Thalassotalea profundi TaxID=2036687 RepID=A0ABQ3J2E6_9GAMM|nr:ketosteroid isomerase family protein [Thalassotalea profundi]GHF01596.1 hypothetical protein GCM10011501_33900 [Thalassotalea profundi]
MKQQLKSFIQNYISCFTQYDVKTLQNFYQLPCTLSTPDKLVLITSSEEFEEEFRQIFTQLKEANTAKFSFKDISFTQVNEAIIMLGGHWTFKDTKQDIFADFFACYHLVKENNKLNIVNVMSHEVENTVTFDEQLVLVQE